MFYKLLNSYVRRSGFPKRGLKYFLKGMRSLGIADKIYQKKLPGGILMNVNPVEHIQQQLFWYGYYEKPVGDMLQQRLQPGSIFIDAGANIGYFSLLAAKQATQGRVIAIEPVSATYKALKENIALNKFTNIEALNLAVGDKEEIRTIYLSDTANTGMASFQQPYNYAGETETVNTVTIDNLVEKLQLPKVDMVKIDVEGNELAVLKGMTQTIEKCKPTILLELNPHTLLRFGHTPADVLSFITSLYYEPFILSEKESPVKLDTTIITDTADLLLVHLNHIDT